LKVHSYLPPFFVHRLAAAHNLTSDFVSRVVHDPVQNQALGNYWQSLITSFLPHDEQGWQADISGEPWVINDSRPRAVDSPEEFQRFFVGLARRYQDHRFHNHSCFKEMAPGGAVNYNTNSNQQRSSGGPADPSSAALATLRSQSEAAPSLKRGQKRLKETLCRFIRPVPAFSYPPQYVQLVMLDLESPSAVGPVYVVRALRGIEALPLGHAFSLISKERRCLEFQFARPSNGSGSPDLSQSPYFPLEDGQDPNCWYIECSRAITVGTGAHNNVQHLDGRDLGGAAYMSKYLVKNNLKPEKSLSILYEALRHVARYPSVAPDVEADPASRRLVHIVERVLNSTRGAIELSMPLILGRLLGMQQFETTHSYRSIYLTDAVGFVRKRSRGLDSAPPMADETPNEDEAFVPGIVADDIEEAQGDLARDGSGRLALVSQKIDYLYRDALLADWNLAEFAITFYKCPNDGTPHQGEERHDGSFLSPIFFIFPL
jgi:hypothetical protein